MRSVGPRYVRLFTWRTPTASITSPLTSSFVARSLPSRSTRMDPAVRTSVDGAKYFISTHKLEPQAVLNHCDKLMQLYTRAQQADCACPSGVCGKVWKTGDTVYHCRTCGMDPSCAICHECFMHSDHTGHDCARLASPPHTFFANCSRFFYSLPWCCCGPSTATHSLSAAIAAWSLARTRRLDVLLGWWLLRLWRRRGVARVRLLLAPPGPALNLTGEAHVR